MMENCSDPSERELLSEKVDLLLEVSFKDIGIKIKQAIQFIIKKIQDLIGFIIKKVKEITSNIKQLKPKKLSKEEEYLANILSQIVASPNMYFDIYDYIKKDSKIEELINSEVDDIIEQKIKYGNKERKILYNGIEEKYMIALPYVYESDLSISKIIDNKCEEKRDEYVNKIDNIFEDVKNMVESNKEKFLKDYKVIVDFLNKYKYASQKFGIKAQKYIDNISNGGTEYKKKISAINSVIHVIDQDYNILFKLTQSQLLALTNSITFLNLLNSITVED